MPLERSRKYKERIKAAIRIERRRTEISPCLSYVKSGRRYIILNKKSSRYSKCIRQGKGACDTIAKMPSSGEQESLACQRRRLQLEEEEAMAKILRLRKQQRLLNNREKEMLNRGLRTLDELDAELEKEKITKKRIKKEARV